MNVSYSVARISEFSKALSEEIRIRILICLEGGPLGLQHFVNIFGMAPSTLSKHLHILESAGLLVAIRQGRYRLYQWPEESEETPVSGLLVWLEKSIGNDPILEADAARRAVAIQNIPVELPHKGVTRVIFLCTGNSCRSQMAEALLRERGGSRFEVASAGVSPRAISSLTADVMDEIGIDLSHHRPKSVMEFMGKTYFDYLITVCAMAEEHTPVFPGVTRRLHWPVEDPVETEGTEDEKKKVFRRVRDQLDERVTTWLKELN